jgi:membrane protein implicated in regulation of membrane protease activity
VASHPQPTTYPLRSDYVDALQNPLLTLADPVLKNGRVECDRLGLPKPISGAFASVFQVTAASRTRWAVKCFCQFVPDQEHRYREISGVLTAMHHPAMVEFDYQQHGILTGGSWFPILKMRWVEAQGLLPWLEANRFDPQRLRAIAEQLVSLVADLEEAGVAHGDLQHGNLLIDRNNRLRLIDYDGMYVPALDGLPANEKGMVNYQPPSRTDQFQAGLDRFAGWIIYASLIAVAAAPQLWQLRADGDEKLLFDASDYTAPDQSPALAALRATGDAHLASLAGLIAQMARTDVNDMPALDPTSLPGRPGPPPSSASQRTSTSLPTWMDRAAIPTRSPVGAPTPASAAASGTLPHADGSWLAQHLPPSPRKTYTGSRVRVVRAAAVLALVVGIAAAAAGPLLAFSLLLGAAGAGICLLVVLVALLAGYHRQSLTREARTTRGERAVAQRTHTEAQRVHQTLLDQRARVDADLQQRRTAIAQQRDAASVELQQTTSAIQTTLSTALSHVIRELAAINASETSRRQARLQQIQTAHVNQRLSLAQINKNPPPGIGAQLSKRLAQHGISTAADFSGFYVTGSTNTRDETTWIQLANNRQIHVDGIGPKKAQSLIDWRDRLISNARLTAPKQLSVTDERQIQSQLYADRERQEQQAAAAKQKAIQDQAAATNNIRARRLELDRQETEARDLASAQRANYERQIINAQLALATRRSALDQLNHRCRAYETVTFRRYVTFVTSGKA